MKFVVIGCLCAGALAAVGCADGPGGPTGPSASTAGTEGIIAASLPAAPRSGDLHVRKECSGAGPFCTIKGSNVKAIEVDSIIRYLQPDQLGTPSGSDIVLDTPGPGNNKAFGHCRLNFATRTGLCTLSGGTGKFNGFEASANVSHLGGPDWAWDGTYSFNSRD